MVQAAYQVKPPAVAGQKSGSVRSVQKMFYGFVTGVDNEASPTTFTVYFPEQHDLAEESRTYVQFRIVASAHSHFSAFTRIALNSAAPRHSGSFLAITGVNNIFALLPTAAEERPCWLRSLITTAAVNYASVFCWLCIDLQLHSQSQQEDQESDRQLGGQRSDCSTVQRQRWRCAARRCVTCSLQLACPICCITYTAHLNCTAAINSIILQSSAAA
jgi:hypothetical protein